MDDDKESKEYMKKYALIVENNKELKDYIDILNEISKEKNIFVKIILLADIYKDNAQFETIKFINFPYDMLCIKNPYNYSFVKLPNLVKIKLVLQNKNKIFNFISDVHVLLSGVQTVFERVLYSQIKSKKLDIKTIVYHRHLLFDDGVNTKKNWKSSILIKQIFSLFGLQGFFIDVKAVGFADQYIVLGYVNQQYLVNNGILATNVHPLGSLEYDNLDLITEKEINYKKQVCYITGACEWIGDIKGEQYQNKKIHEYCNFFEDKLDLYDVWVRVHPREPLDKYKRLQEKYPYIKLQYMTNNPLLFDLNQFDILIGGVSTVLFEANLINKLIVFFLLEEEMYRYHTLIHQLQLQITTCLSMEFKFQSNLKNIIYYDKSYKAIDRITCFINSIK